MIRNVDEAFALLKRTGVMTVVPARNCPSLLDEIIGEPVKGSWWGHPKGGEVFRILDALGDHPDVLITKLVDGKNTLVHRALWPDLLRLVQDETWRAEAKAALDAAGRALVKRIEEAGEVLAEKLPPTARRAKDPVAKTLLVHSEQRHTESGKHETVFRTWEAWSASHGAKASAVGFDASLARIEGAIGADGHPFRKARRRA